MSFRRTVMWTGLLLAVAVSGCATPPAEESPPDVTLRDLDTPPERTSAGTEERANHDGDGSVAERNVRTATAVSLQSFEFPLEFTLEEAFAYAKPAPLPRLSLGVWQANGIRVAVLPLEEWRDFYAELPEALAVQQTRILASDDPVPVVTSRRLVRPIRIDLTVPPMRPRETWARRGRLRLLAEVATQNAGDDAPGSTDANRDASVEQASDRRRVSLIPHHLLPQQIVLPESTRADRMPGVLFDRLALRMDLSADTLLILALDRPWDREAAEPRDSLDAPGAPGLPEQEGEERDDVESPPVADRGGRVSRDDRGIVSAMPSESAEAGAAAASSGDGNSADEKVQEESSATDPPADTPRSSEVSEVPPNLGRALLTGQKWDRPRQRLVVISVRPLQTGGNASAP